MYKKIIIVPTTKAPETGKSEIIFTTTSVVESSDISNSNLIIKKSLSSEAAPGFFSNTSQKSNPSKRYMVAQQFG